MDADRVSRKLQTLGNAADYDAEGGGAARVVIPSPASSTRRAVALARAGSPCDGTGDDRRRAQHFPPETPRRTSQRSFTPGISYAIANGRRIPLLRILMSNYCELDCFYCVHRKSRNTRRAFMGPKEIVYATMEYHRRGLIEGLFLSSGVHKNPDWTMAKMIDAVRELRTRERYRGYIHLKIMPGASDAAVAEAVRWADRVSVNLEAPTPGTLPALAPEKHFARSLMAPFREAQKVVNAVRGRWTPPRRHNPSRRPAPTSLRAGMVTQFVVGPAGESDRQLLTRSAHLYDTMDMRRVYYSAFSPVAETPLDALAAEPPLREHRLYQADFLLARYDFALQDLPFDASGSLPRDTDPKRAWAYGHPEYFPVEVMRASYEELLRVPGIGPAAARRIIVERRRASIRTVAELRALGAQAAWARPFITLCGRRPRAGHDDPAQLELWSPTGGVQVRG